MKITVEFDADLDVYQLFVSDGRMASMPAGPRLFRGDPPVINFQHADPAAAATDAAVLQKYLSELEPQKRLTKKQLAEAA